MAVEISPLCGAFYYLTTQNDKAHKRKQKNKKKPHYESLRDLWNTIKVSTYTLCELQKEKKKGGKTLEK